MTVKEVKDITAWMRENGVLRFSVDGLSVDFAAFSVKRMESPPRKTDKPSNERPTFMGMDEEMLLRST